MEDLRTLIELCAGAVATVGAFWVGRKKTNAEATQTAFEAYNVALNSLRKEIEENGKRWDEIRKSLEDKIEIQGKEIDGLKKENQELRAKVQELTKQKSV